MIRIIMEYKEVNYHGPGNGRSNSHNSHYFRNKIMNDGMANTQTKTILISTPVRGFSCIYCMPFGIPPTLCWEEFGHQFANQESFLASREGPGAHFGDLVASIFTSWNPVPRKVQLPPARADQTDHFWEPKWKHF